MGIPLIDALISVKLCKTKTEARNIIKQGGVYINNCRQNQEDYLLTTKDLASETMIVLRVGKKKYAILKFV